jgi:exonuclease VII large subunit
MLAFQQQNTQTLDGEYIFSVRELNQAARDSLENHFQVLWVSGEISNLSHPASGHMYFTLKDAAAQVRCAWFRGKQGPTRFQVKNGQQVYVYPASFALFYHLHPKTQSRL